VNSPLSSFEWPPRRWRYRRFSSSPCSFVWPNRPIALRRAQRRPSWKGIINDNHVINVMILSPRRPLRGIWRGIGRRATPTTYPSSKYGCLTMDCCLAWNKMTKNTNCWESEKRAVMDSFKMDSRTKQCVLQSYPPHIIVSRLRDFPARGRRFERRFRFFGFTFKWGHTHARC